MSINVSQSFKRTSANPVDETLTLTKAQMLAVDDNLMPSKYLTVCVDDGQIYLYDKSATADAETGKFRLYKTEYTAGDGISIDANDEISADIMPSSDMEEVAYPLPPVTGATNPTGAIVDFMAVRAPDGYLFCNGDTYNISDYPRLAAFFESQFGTKNHFGGDGTTTFAVPDLRGEFRRCTGTNGHTNQGNGANVGVHQDATTSSKYSTAPAGTQHAIIYNSGNRLYPTNFDSEFLSANGTLGLVTLTGTSGSTGNTKDLITSRPTNTSVLTCIKY